MSARSDRVIDTFAAVSGDALTGLVAESVRIVEGRRADAVTAALAAFTLEIDQGDGPSRTTFDVFVADNECLEDEVIDAIGWLAVGESRAFDMGAGGTFTARRIS